MLIWNNKGKTSKLGLQNGFSAASEPYLIFSGQKSPDIPMCFAGL